jgi:hypothetical protein
MNEVEVEMSKIGLALLIVLGMAFASCGDDPALPAWPDGGGNGNGTDDPDICEPNTASNWGGTCAKFAPDCPPNTVCQTVEGMGSTYGICSTECCGQNDPDEAAHCPSVAAGLSTCIILDEVQDRWYCAVVCTNESHCPDGEGQTCQPTPEASQSICYPPQE